jgi:predicted O-methyltransferase YrrM
MKKLSRAALSAAFCSVVALIGGFCPALAQAADKEDPNMAASAQLQKSRDEFVKNFKRIGLNTTPGDAMMLRILIESSGAKNGVEVGTATGYGAMVMGLGFERNGGHLTSVDIDPKMVKTARENLETMKLGKTVTVVEGDALKALPKLEGQYDFVFIDALKRDYLKYLKALEPKLKPGAIIVADNVVKSAKEMPDYLEAVQNSPNYHTVIIRASEEKGDGMAVSYKVK